MKEDIGIYIHIPFCKSKCYYCDFNSFANKEELVEEYVLAVCNEILQNAEILSQSNIKSIYIGGGTPSYIDYKYIEKILSTIYMFVDDIKNIDEITIEVNPVTHNLEKFKKYKEFGINRISLGVQSIFDDVLKNIGRAHRYEDVISTLEDLNKACISNISVDLMYPLPQLTYTMFEETLNKILDMSDKYNIKHISVYNLEVHTGSKLDFLISNNFLSLPDEDEEYKMKKLIDEKLPSYGFYKYEISNYAKKDYYSRHNTLYWKQGHYLGFGAGASSFILSTRYENEKDIKEYIYKINNSINPNITAEQMDKLDLMKEYMILNLRMVQGVDKSLFYAKFKKNVSDIFDTEVKSLIKKGLLEQTKTNIFLTNRGMEVANIVWEEFI